MSSGWTRDRGARRAIAAWCAALLLAAAGASPARAASEFHPAPEGALAGAPGEYTSFAPRELARGFLAVAFGSDMHFGAPAGIRRFNAGARIAIEQRSRVDRATEYRDILEKHFATIPHLPVAFAARAEDANVVVHLIDERDFKRAIGALVGEKVAAQFIRKTDPECVTRVRSAADGAIERADVFITADQGNEIFRDCAFHETLHGFGLTSHDNANPWTTLNQNRTVGYQSVYDRALLTLLYDPAIKLGQSKAAVARLLPGLIRARFGCGERKRAANAVCRLPR